MSERITIQSGDVGRLEDVLNPKDPLVSAPRETARQIAEQLDTLLENIRRAAKPDRPFSYTLSAADAQLLDRQFASLTADLAQARQEVKDRDEVLTDTRRLARAIDVAMHGEDGAAKQASLCDLVGPARDLRSKLAAAEQARDEALKESEWRGEKLQEVGRLAGQLKTEVESAARIALLEAAADAEITYGRLTVAAWLRARAGGPRTASTPESLGSHRLEHD